MTKNNFSEGMADRFKNEKEGVEGKYHLVEEDKLISSLGDIKKWGKRIEGNERTALYKYIYIQNEFLTWF